MTRKIVKVLALALAIIAALLGFVYLIAWKSPQYYTLTTPSPQHDTIIAFKDYHLVADHPRPYIVEGKQFIIFGSEHTRDPEHPEIKIIEEKWRSLKPTVALVEGRLGFLLPGLMDPVKELGEGGKVKLLAGRSGIPIYNWDLSKEMLASRLQPAFQPEQIALAQILNPYFGALRFGKPASPETYIQEYLQRAAYVGQGENFKTVADVDRVWKKYFPIGKDWRDTSDEYELPGYLSQMMTYTNDLRNRQLIAVVKELLAKGERVFAIAGSSHAVCVAPSFQ